MTETEAAAGTCYDCQRIARTEQTARDYHRFLCNRCRYNRFRPATDEWGPTADVFPRKGTDAGI